MNRSLSGNTLTGYLIRPTGQDNKVKPCWLLIAFMFVLLVILFSCLSLI